MFKRKQQRKADQQRWDAETAEYRRKQYEARKATWPFFVCPIPECKEVRRFDLQSMDYLPRCPKHDIILVEVPKEVGILRSLSHLAETESES